MKVIGIVGTRSRDDNGTFSLIKEQFFKIYEKGDWICSGGCPQGGDRFAEKIAKDHGIPIIIFYPAWHDLNVPGAVVRRNKYSDKYGEYNANAGFDRNTPIAHTSNALIASVATSRTGGTEDTISKYLAEGKADLYLV